MGIFNIKKESVAKGKDPISSKLKVEKYEDSGNALNLIAHICTSGKELDLFPCFEKFENDRDVCLKAYKDYYGLECVNDDVCYIARLWSLKYNLVYQLEESSTPMLKIAFAGGYSAGKSSLLNKLTGIGDTLPTGIEPVSLVNTRLNCTPKAKVLNIKGKNLKNEIIGLNVDVLDCIKHSSSSKVYIAPVLKSLMIDIPVPANSWMANVSFIDTPGIDNSVHENKENGLKDIDTAKNAISNTDAVFWCVDSERGDLPKADAYFLKEALHDNEDKPLVIIFTKADKKNEQDIRNILKTAKRTVDGELRAIKNVQIIAVSKFDDKVISDSNASFASIIAKLKQNWSGKDYISEQLAKIDLQFNNEIKLVDEEIEELKEQRADSVKARDIYYKLVQDCKIESPNKWKMDFVNEFVDEYENFKTSYSDLFDLFKRAKQGWSNSLDREIDEWPGKVGLFDSIDSLKSRIQGAIADYNAMIKVEPTDYKTWTSTWLREFLTDLVPNDNESLDKYKNSYNEMKDSVKNIDNSLEKAKGFTMYLNSTRDSLKKCLQECYQNALKITTQYEQNVSCMKQDASHLNIFTCISSGNMEGFLACLAEGEGVDMTKTNEHGYTPLTWTAHVGNNQIMTYLLSKNEVDIALKDNRGYNALETAVMVHNKGICELLIKKDRSLILQSKDLVELAKQNKFVEWINMFN